MATISIINLAGLLLNILGTVILGFSTSKYMTSIHGAITIHDMQINSLIKHEKRVLVGDIPKLMKTGVEDSRKKTMIGFAVLVIGFAIQLLPYVLESLKTKV